MMSNKFLILVVLFIFSMLSCKEKADEKFHFDKVKVDGGLWKVTIPNSNKPINIYFDSLDRIVQVDNFNSELLENNFKIAFDKFENVAYVKNEYSGELREYWLNEGNKDLLFRTEKNGFRYQTVLIDEKNPTIYQSVVKLDNSGKYLSTSRTFDMSQMKTIDDSASRYIIDLNGGKMFKKGEYNTAYFQVVTPCDKIKLIKSDFDISFKHRKDLDTIDIEHLFKFDFTSDKTVDTLRFIVYNFDSKSGLGNSIYYELPINLK